MSVDHEQVEGVRATLLEYREALTQLDRSPPDKVDTERLDQLFLPGMAQGLTTYYERDRGDYYVVEEIESKFDIQSIEIERTMATATVWSYANARYSSGATYDYDNNHIFRLRLEDDRWLIESIARKR